MHSNPVGWSYSRWKDVATKVSWHLVYNYRVMIPRNPGKLIAVKFRILDSFTSNLWNSRRFLFPEKLFMALAIESKQQISVKNFGELLADWHREGIRFLSFAWKLQRRLQPCHIWVCAIYHNGGKWSLMDVTELTLPGARLARPCLPRYIGSRSSVANVGQSIWSAIVILSVRWSLSNWRTR